MRVILTTSKGDITIELDAEKAPISSENFLSYVDNGDYDGTIFHRVIDGFMIQGGAFEPDMNQRRGRDPIKNEWKNGLKNVRGSLAMARTSDPDSASNQFFINVADNDFLDKPRDGAGYAVFGRVVEGLDVIDAIKGVKTTDRAGHGDVPVEPIVLESAKRAE
ncbi:MAG: peptidyl-prolyl cis-trans isomerase [Phycisphaeraceae bacterium]|nr:MAG: peptidyl-prolyl cis-trans isomerase [Phycisphaeraceae bacterium]